MFMVLKYICIYFQKLSDELRRRRGDLQQKGRSVSTKFLAKIFKSLFEKKRTLFPMNLGLGRIGNAVFASQYVLRSILPRSWTSSASTARESSLNINSSKDYVPFDEVEIPVHVRRKYELGKADLGGLVRGCVYTWSKQGILNKVKATPWDDELGEQPKNKRPNRPTNFLRPEEPKEPARKKKKGGEGEDEEKAECNTGDTANIIN
eukprot:g77691.t1